MVPSTLTSLNAASPQKWRKYELLVTYGLANESELRLNIRRFRATEHGKFLSQLRQELRGAEAEESTRFFFVVKFVPPALAMLLPNVRVHSLKDIPAVERALESHASGNYSEIWFCRTDVTLGRFSVAGRILIDARGGKLQQTIEQVWRCSPRLIESIGPNFAYPFARATRAGWRWSATIDQIHAPDTSPETSDELRRQFGEALRMIDQRRERLEAFVEAVLSADVQVCCLEYKIEGTHFQIIDWDTTNDGQVLRGLLP